MVDLGVFTFAAIFLHTYALQTSNNNRVVGFSGATERRVILQQRDKILVLRKMPKVTKGILKKYSLRKKQRCKFKQVVKVCKFDKYNTVEELGKRVCKNKFEQVNLKS